MQRRSPRGCASPHSREIAPEVRETLRSAEQRREVRRVDEQDVAGALALRRHPEQRVELLVARRRERMRALEIDGLLSEHADATRVLRRDSVVRQMRVEV